MTAVSQHDIKAMEKEADKVWQMVLYAKERGQKKAFNTYMRKFNYLWNKIDKLS